MICSCAVLMLFFLLINFELQIEARSVEHHRKVQKGMENKIITLTQKIEEMVGIV